MAKHSRYEKQQRAAQTARVHEIEAAWLGSLSAESAREFRAAVEVARNRPPAERAPDMAPGTSPRPPRFEPRPPKEERPRRSRS
jgi:hypothetical protein